MSHLHVSPPCQALSPSNAHACLPRVKADVYIPLAEASCSCCCHHRRCFFAQRNACCIAASLLLWLFLGCHVFMLLGCCVASGDVLKQELAALPAHAVVMLCSVSWR